MKQYPYANAIWEITWEAESEVSNPVSLENIAPRGFGVEIADITDWETANIGFQVSNDVDDDDSWIDVLDAEGARVVLKVGVAGLYAAPAEMWLCGAYAFVRLASLDASDNETPVQQTAAPNMKLVFAQ